MTEVTLLMADVSYEGSSVLAVFNQEEMADEAICIISEWHKNKPDLPKDDAPNSEWDFYSAYNDTFPFGNEYYADRYYTVKHELR